MKATKILILWQDRNDPGDVAAMLYQKFVEINCDPPRAQEDLEIILCQSDDFSRRLSESPDKYFVIIPGSFLSRKKLMKVFVQTPIAGGTGFHCAKWGVIFSHQPMKTPQQTAHWVNHIAAQVHAWARKGIEPELPYPWGNTGKPKRHRISRPRYDDRWKYSERGIGSGAW